MDDNAVRVEKDMERKAEQAALDKRAAATVRPFVERFAAAHERGVESIMAMADALHEAKQAIPYGDFTRAFKGATNPLPGGAVFPITVDVAERLMRLRKQPVFRDSTLTRFLPASPTALYELVPVEPKVLEKAIREGAGPSNPLALSRIRPDMTVADARRVARTISDRAEDEYWDRVEEQRRQARDKRLARMGLAVDICNGCGRKGALGKGVFVDLTTRLCQQCSPSKRIGRWPKSRRELKRETRLDVAFRAPEPRVWTIEFFRRGLRNLLDRERDTHGYSTPFEQRIPALVREMRATAALLEDYQSAAQPVGVDAPIVLASQSGTGIA